MGRLKSLLWLLFFWGCVKKPTFSDSPPQPAYQGLLILNEGQWALNNSSIDVLSPEGTYYENAFQVVNRQPLGDVANHWVREGDTLWVVLNGSRLLRCIALPSLRERYSLPFPPSASPREFLRVSPTKAYVNSLLDGSIYRLNPQTGQLLPPPIPVENFSESLVSWEGFVWISCGNYAYPQRNNKLACIDPATDSVIAYLPLPEENPGPLLGLPNGELLVGCRGNYADRPGLLVHVAPHSRTITRTTPLRGSVYRLQRYGQEVYMLTDSGVSRYDWQQGTVDYSFLNRQELGIPPHELPYGFFYDSIQSVWVVANARAGGTRGELIFVGPDGVTRRLPTGVFPARLFRYP